MTAITDYITLNIVLFMLAGTFLIISFQSAAWLIFRAIFFVAGVLLCAATGIFSVNFMMLGITAPPTVQWYDMGTLMYFARFIFGGMIIFAQVKGFISWQRGQGGKWLCIGATALSVFMSVYTFHADMAKSAAKAAQSSVKASVKYNAMVDELARLKELRDGTEKEKKSRIADLRANPKNYTLQEDKERKYFDERISGFNTKIEVLADELDSYERKKRESGGVVVSTKSTFSGIAADAVFFFNLESAFWQPRLEMLFQYLMIAGLSLLADCAAMSFIIFGLGLLDDVEKERRPSFIWLLKLRPQARHFAGDAWKKMGMMSAWACAQLGTLRRRNDAPLPAASDAALTAPDVYSDANITEEVKSDVVTDLIEKSGDASEDEALLLSQHLVPEIKVNGVTVRGFDDVTSAKQFMINFYQKKDSYRAVYRELGISANTSSAGMLKAVLDEAGVPHGDKKKKVNGRSRSFKKLRPVAEAGSLI